MNKTTKFINENSVEDVIKYIEFHKLNIENVVIKSKEARKEFGLKVQEIINKLENRS